jgi:molybdopterin-containing oxidoreductase family membrane subunit
MKEVTHDEDLLKPMRNTTIKFYIVFIILLALATWSLYAWHNQLRHGLSVTGLRDISVSTPWGLYISNFIFFVGLAHGGIAISAAVRIAGLKSLKSITRIAEVLTPIALLMAGLNIVFDLGRPDRMFNLIVYYLERVGQSPLAWDLTVIIIYFILSTTYLYLTMRSDLAILVDRFPKWRWLYKLLLIGYSEGEEEKIEKIAWWMALCIPILLVLLSGGVIAWLLGLMIARPGWFGAFMGPYFVTAAIASAIAAVIVISALFRRIFGWEEYIKIEVFKGLGNFLAVLMFTYLYFMFAEHITMQYPGPFPIAEVEVSHSVLFGEFSTIFWFMLIVLFVAPSLALFAQVIYKRYSIKVTAGSALLILIGLWIKRFVIVVPPLTRSLIPFPIGIYNPSWVEWSLVIGTFSVSALMYMIFMKIFPLIPISEVEK